MLFMLPLLIADPSLPFDVRLALLGTPEEAAQALLGLGLSCPDVKELVGINHVRPCEA